VGGDSLAQLLSCVCAMIGDARTEQVVLRSQPRSDMLSVVVLWYGEVGGGGGRGGLGGLGCREQGCYCKSECVGCGPNAAGCWSISRPHWWVHTVAAVCARFRATSCLDAPKPNVLLAVRDGAYGVP
jgi:hypothetical protein